MYKSEFAENLFNAQIRFAELECQLFGHIDKILGESSWVDVTFDYYDCSLEIYGVSDQDLTTDQKAEFASLGFALVWMHKHLKSVNRDLIKKDEVLHQLR